MSFLSLHPFLLGIDFTKHSVPVFSFPHPSSPVFFLSATIHLFFVFSGLEVDRTVAYEHFKQRLRVRLSWRRALREMVVRICIAVRAISSHRFTVHESFPLLLFIPLPLLPFLQLHPFFSHYLNLLPSHPITLFLPPTVCNPHVIHFILHLFFFIFLRLVGAQDRVFGFPNLVRFSWSTARNALEVSGAAKFKW